MCLMISSVVFRFVKTAISFTQPIQRDKAPSVSYQYVWGTKVSCCVNSRELFHFFIIVYHVLWEMMLYCEN